MSRIVISLTSYPARIHTVHKVIESLFGQIEKADEIVLWLSELDFPRCNEELPTNLKSLEGKHGFCIKWVQENLKSHKKYFYALQEYRDSIVITVDDDMCYAKTMTSTLLASYKRHPYAISARNVHRIFRGKEKIAPYITWDGWVDCLDEERMDLCAIGVNGILYPPRCASERWFDFELIQNCAENQDDLWLKYNEIRDGIPIVFSGLGENDILIEESQESVLYIENAHEGGNDNCIRKLEKHVSDGDIELYSDWMKQLKPLEEYWVEKEECYRLMLKNIFDSYRKNNIYICGAGKIANILYEYIEKMGYEKFITAFLVTNKSETNFIGNICIKKIKDLDEKEKFAVICGVGKKYREEFMNILKKNKLCDWLEVDIQGITYCARLSEYLAANE